jgi:hypothetical protein
MNRSLRFVSLTILTFVVFTISPLAATSIHASTNSFKGINWADTRDNFQAGWVIPDGLYSSDNYATVQTKANNILGGFQNNLGANTVRLPINPASVSQSWWGSYTAAFDTALSKGMKVIIAYWSNANGVVESNFWTMWTTVVNKYGSNSNVYFEIMNEPHGYSASAWTNLAAQWLSTYPSVPASRVIVDGTGYSDSLSSVGADSRLKNCLLSLHIYPDWHKGDTTEAAWKTELENHLAGYDSRAIVTEFGAPMTSGTGYSGPVLNYNIGENNINGNLYIAYMYGIPNQMRANGIGSVYWAGLKSGDSYTMEKLNGSAPNFSLSNTNASGRVQLRWGWGY